MFSKLVTIMIISAGICTFNDSVSLNRLLSTILVEHGIDYAIVVDGKFDTFNWPTELSTDGTMEVIKSYQERYGVDKTRYLPRPNLPEFRKRQEYLVESVRLGVDVCVVMDSDNYVVDANWLEFRREIDELIFGKYSGLNIFNLLVEGTPDSGIYGSHPYIIARPEQIEYYANHYTYKKGGSMGLAGIDTLHGIKLRHSRKYRDSSREYQADKYKQYITSVGL